MRNCLPRIGGLTLIFWGFLWGIPAIQHLEGVGVLAQDLSSEKVNPEPLKVATKVFEPLVFIDSDNTGPRGYSIEVWENIAKRSHLKYEWVIFDTLEDMLDAVKTEEVDLAISGITITAKRENLFDFSHSYYEAGLAIAILDQPENPFQSSLTYLLSWKNLEALGILFGVAFISAHCVWFFERRQNPEMFREEYSRGIWDALWWSLVTATTVGYGDKSPKSIVGRLVAIVWMLVGLFIIAHFTSVFTNHHLQSSINEVRDLFGKKVATVAKSTSAKYLNRHPINIFKFDNIDDAYQALRTGKVTAIVYDAPSLFYRAAQDSDLQVVGTPFGKQDYGIAVVQNSEYLELIDLTILRLQEEGILYELEQKWFPGKSVYDYQLD